MDLRRLTRHPVVDAARSRAAALRGETLAQQLKLVSIPAPPFGEGERAEYFAGELRAYGLEAVSRDEVGNVLARLPYPADPAAPPVVASAHLDTIFPAGTETFPRREGHRIYAPGIADNARGVAALLTLARVLAEAGVRTQAPVWFVGTVGEEGLGDLRGVKHLFRTGSPFRDAAALLSLDGTGLRRIVHRAIGSRRLRVTIRGPGGHSWADWGVANPIHALGATISELRRIAPTESREATLTVARVAGGTSVNAIPAEVWAELDLRSESTEVLERLEAETARVLRDAVEAENAARRAGTAALAVEVQRVGDRPSGAVDADAPIVRIAAAATRAVGARPELGASSTDANVPLALGVPAVTLGAGGESGGIHTFGEWYEDLDAARGVERALLVVLALAGVEDA